MERAAARVQLYNLGTQGVGSGHGLFQLSSQLAERWHNLIDFSSGIGVYRWEGGEGRGITSPKCFEENTMFCVQRAAAGLNFEAESVRWWFQRCEALRKTYMA